MIPEMSAVRTVRNRPKRTKQKKDNVSEMSDVSLDIGHSDKPRTIADTNSEKDPASVFMGKPSLARRGWR